MKFVVWALILGFSTVARAEYSVMKLQGEVTVEEKVLRGKSKVAGGALVESKDPAALIVLKGPAGEIALRGEFQFEMPEASQNKKNKEVLARLLTGRVRVRVPKDLRSKNYFRVRTPTAVVGVRGTDFYLSYWPLLAEAEVICFESEVTFADAEGQSRQVVKAGQWGGLGGRFGSKIAPPLRLSSPVLDHFKRELSFQ